MCDRRSFFAIAGCAALCLGALALSCGDDQCCPCPTDEPGAKAAAPDEAAEADVRPSEPTPPPAPAVEPAPAAPSPAPPAAPGAGPLVAANGVSIVDLVVAKGVEKRQPVEPGTSFAAPQPLKLYAIFNVLNPNLVEDRLVVTWLNPDGVERGEVTLDVPNSPKWKTWAFHGNIKQAGRWEAIVRTADGQELGRAPFEVTE